MSDTDKIQELAEKVVIGTLNGGLLAGLTFRHSDSAATALKEAVTVKAGSPEPQLEGFRGYRVEVEVTIKSAKSERIGTLHGEAVRRIRSPLFWKAGAMEAGMDGNDDLLVMDEEISGDRSEGKKIRSRSITIPLLINKRG